jgi:hypothetical protein
MEDSARAGKSEANDDIGSQVDHQPWAGQLLKGIHRASEGEARAQDSDKSPRRLFALVTGVGEHCAHRMCRDPAMGRTTQLAH